MGYLKEDPSVSIIIPTYNGKHLLKGCLSSLYELEYPSKRLDIKLVDNNSTDGTAQYVRRYFRRVEVFRSPENNYCKANNLGIAHSRSPLLAFLNNDTTVDKHWLRALVDSIHQDKRIGCVGSKVLFPDGKIQGTGHYEFPNFRWGDRGLREPDLGQYDAQQEVGSFSGTSVLFRRLCLDDVGYFDEDFVMYLEDVDIFLRCRQKNWKLLYVPTSIVRHSFHGTADEKQIHFYIERNRLLLIAKHFPRELSRALETKGSSLTNDELYRILPDLFFKLFTHHTNDSLKPVLNDFFSSLQRVYNLSKDQVVQELNARFKEAAECSETISREKISLQEVIKRLENDLQVREVEKPRLETTILKLGEDIERKYTTISEQKKLLTEREVLLQQASELKTVLEAALSQKDAEIATLRNNLSGMSARIDGLQVEIAQQQEAYQSLVHQRDELQQQVTTRSAELEQKHKEVEGLRNELNAFQHKVELLQVEAAHQQEAYQSLVRQRDELQQQVTTRSAELEQKHKEVEGLRSELSVSQHKVELLQVEAAHQQEAYAALVHQRDELQQQVTTRSAELEQKHKEVEELRRQLDTRSAELRQSYGEIEELWLLISRQGEEIGKLTGEFMRVKTEAENLSGQLRHANEVTIQQNAQISAMQQQIDAQAKLIFDKDAYIQTIFHSRTYRYLAIPLWCVADFVKKFILRQGRKKRILVIKPYYVSVESTENALADLRNKYINAHITLFANVFKPDYERLNVSALAEHKILYSPAYKKLTFLRLLTTTFWLNARYFDHTVLLIGPAVYQGYRKGKLLAFAIGGRSIHLYYCGAKALAPFVSFGLLNRIKTIGAFVWGVVAFWLVLVFFISFVVIPLKLKKVFRR